MLRGEYVPWVHGHKTRSRYIEAAVLSFPPWVDRKVLMEMKERAALMTRLMGELYVLDHIVPLNHPRVCGLSVPWNLRVVTARENGKKGNGWCEWHGELFSEPEQLTLQL